MKAELTITNIYWNKGLSNFFFRDQALKTLDEITEDMDVDVVEECFYSMSLNELEDEFCIELEEDEDESEEDE